MSDTNNIVTYIVRCNEATEAFDLIGETTDLAVFETRDEAESYMQEYLEVEYGPDYATSIFKEIELVESDDHANIEIYAIKHDGTELKLWIEERILYA